jgi:hypothetical protein
MWMDFCAFPSGRVVVGSFGSSGLNVNNNNDLRQEVMQ